MKKMKKMRDCLSLKYSLWPFPIRKIILSPCLWDKSLRFSCFTSWAFLSSGTVCLLLLALTPPLEGTACFRYDSDALSKFFSHSSACPHKSCNPRTFSAFISVSVPTCGSDGLFGDFPPAVLRYSAHIFPSTQSWPPWTAWPAPP